MHSLPFQSFFASLESSEIRPTVRDYERILTALKAGGPWTLESFRDTLMALLTKDHDEQLDFHRRFHAFFEPEINSEEMISEVDIQRLIAEIRQLVQDPLSRSIARRDSPGRVVQPVAEPAQNTKRHRFMITLGLTALCLTAGLLFIAKTLLNRPAIKFSTESMDFGEVSIGKTVSKYLTIRNPGKGMLRIDSIKLSNDSLGAFTLQPALAPEGSISEISPERSKTISVQFKPQKELSYRSTLSISSNARKSAYDVLIFGRGKTLVEDSVPPTEPPASGDPEIAGAPVVAEEGGLSKPTTRIYSGVPTVKDRIQSVPIVLPTTWKMLTWLAAIFSIFTGLYGAYLWKSTRIPEDKPAKCDPEKPGEFSMESLGGRPAPRFTKDALDHFADSMEYFRSDLAGKRLDTLTSIKSTICNGGTPSVNFFSEKRIRSLLILEDAFAEAVVWNPTASELAMGMQNRGIPVVFGRFYGSPAEFLTNDGSKYQLDDFEDQGRGFLLLLFSDGKIFYGQRHRFILESIARWPMVAWLDLREPKFWDNSVHVISKYNIPVYPADTFGIQRALEQFLTETGSSAALGSATTPNASRVWQAGLSIDSDIEELLGDALPWAQDCAMIQPLSVGLADKIRLQFYPHLPPERIGRLFALPDTSSNQSGLRFADKVRKVLREQYIARRDTTSHAERTALWEFLEDELEGVRPNAEADSLAFLSWEMVKERIRFDLDPMTDVKRLNELSKTPLEGAISESLEGFGPRSTQSNEAIPVINEFTDKHALQRISQITKGTFPGIRSLKTYPVPWAHRVAFCLFVMVSIGSIIGGIHQFIAMLKVKNQPNWIVKGDENPPASLEIIMDTDSASKPKKNSTTASEDQWKFVDSGPLQSLAQARLVENHTYRIHLFGGGFSSSEVITKHPNSVLEMDPVIKDKTSAECQENFPEIGLAIERCGEISLLETRHPPETTSLNETTDGIPIKGWKERLGDMVPTGRELSIGLEIVESGNDPVHFREVRTRLLTTGSVDVIYRIQVDQSNPDKILKALDKIMNQVRPWIAQCQITLWNDDISSVSKDLAQFLKKFDRFLDISVEDYSKWPSAIKGILSPGDSKEIPEDKIVANLGISPGRGHGTGVLWIRPLSTAGVLIVDIKPENATVSITPKGGSDAFTITAGKAEELDAGDYVVTGNAVGYQEQQKSITIVTGEEQILSMELEPRQPATGLLKVITTPEGATISAIHSETGDKHTGESGDVLELPISVWTVTAKLEGHTYRTESIEISEEDEKVLEWTLGPLPPDKGTITISTIPASISLSITRKGENEFVWEGVSGDLVELLPDTYVARSTLKGYEPLEKKFTLHKDANAPITLIFTTSPPQTGSIRVTIYESSEKGQKNPIEGDITVTNKENFDIVYEGNNEKTVELDYTTYLVQANVGGRQSNIVEVEIGDSKEITVELFLELDSRTGDSITTTTDRPEFGKDWILPEIGMELIAIEPGEFWMGSGRGDNDEKPAHRVRITRPFWMGKYEVTKKQYHLITQINPRKIANPKNPVKWVSWKNAVKFCRDLNDQEHNSGRLPDGYVVRLPTEAEWEYACRAGSTTEYYFGSNSAENLYQFGNFASPWISKNKKDPFKATAPGGSFLPNQWELYDMHGNVSEWCLDRYSRTAYQRGDASDPTGPEKGFSRVVRGGNWYNSAFRCRSASRHWVLQVDVNPYVGVRVVLAPGQEEIKRTRPEQGKAWTIPEMGMQMAPISAGTFTMGFGGGGEDETPVHQVTINSSFWAGTFEVTQEEYTVIMKSNPSEFKNPRNPVESVSWTDASEFCKKLTKREEAAERLPPGSIYRLPTEAEWEYICRAGTATSYSFGDNESDLARFGNYCDRDCKNSLGDSNSSDGYATTSPVGSFKPNPWGVNDMHGNVWEWCLDWYSKTTYLRGDSSDPIGPETGTIRVLRGGSWSLPAEYCRSASRDGDVPSYELSSIGFRVVLAPGREERK